ncbi:MAG: flavodoxin domain-containing protein [Candidatus Omnitrophica bacterium]|nr:flavodoxin domain-containing protein [Candidatus Omnitrophota bacterium]HOX54120.1 flavodoxin domain-containing protein [Candidatus Omnitrophota bacterium]
MAQILVIYYTQSGNTEKMAQAIAEGIEKEGVQYQLKKVQDAKPDDLLKADGILIGSPTYYGSMAFQIKELLDQSVKFHSKLDGKAGGAFSSSANIGGGNETTILDILNAMLIHGMIIQGDPSGDHYGPVAIGSPDARASKQCVRFGQRFAKLVKKTNP